MLLLEIAKTCSEVFCIALLLVLLGGIIDRKNSEEHKALLGLIFADIAYILFSICTHLLDGRVFEFATELNYVVNILLCVSDAILGLAAFSYLHIVSSGQGKKHWIFYLPAVVMITMTFCTPATGWFFTIDAQNNALDGTLQGLREGMAHFYFVLAFFDAIFYRQKKTDPMKKKKASIAAGFVFFPIIFFMTHLMIYEMELHCFGVTLGIISVYIRLQKRSITITLNKLAVERENAVLYRNTMLSTALQFMVVNLTEGKITELSVPRRADLSLYSLIAEGAMPSDNYKDVLEMWNRNIPNLSEEEKWRMFSPESLIARFQNGEDQMSDRYAVRNASGELVYCRQEIMLARNKRTGDIISTITHYDVTAQSEREESYIVQKRVIEALAYGVTSYWIIDWDTEKFIKHHIENEMIRSIAERVASTGTYSAAIRDVYMNFVDKGQRDEAVELFRMEHIRERLEEQKQYVVPIHLYVPELALYAQFSFTRIEINNRKAIIMSTRNITETVEKEMGFRAELSDALDRARDANKAKSTFLFNISHDIRTPMNAILGFNEIALKSVRDNEQASKALVKAKYAGEHMLNLINDILDMSRIENGKMEIREELIDVKEHISRFEDMFRMEMEQKKLNFYVIDDTYSSHIYGDYLRITQIIANLLSNAAKFTPEGGTVTYHGVEFDPGEAGYTAFRISVRDTGIGISEKFLDKLFNPFERERSSTGSGVQGTGLGLAIAKQLTDLMGGTLTCHSEVGKGTEFVLTIKTKIAEPPTQKEEAVIDEKILDGKRVLLVEDNALNREIAEVILSELGMDVIEADDGAVAVQMLRSWSGEYPDVILMDIQMPQMDGYMAAKAIRAMEGPIATLPIIAMTANAFEEDKRKAIESGMDAHMAKPISVQGMTEALCAVLQSKKKS